MPLQSSDSGVSRYASIGPDVCTFAKYLSQFRVSNVRNCTAAAKARRLHLRLDRLLSTVFYPIPAKGCESSRKDLPAEKILKAWRRAMLARRTSAWRIPCNPGSASSSVAGVKSNELTARHVQGR